MKTADAERNPRQPEEYMYEPGYAPGSRWNGETPKEQWVGYGAGDGYKSNNQATVILGWGGNGYTCIPSYAPGAGGDKATPQPSGGSGVTAQEAQAEQEKEASE